MNYKHIFFLPLVIITTACLNQPVKHGATITMDVVYLNYNSLEDSKSERHGTLTYVYDSVLYYNLLTSDSVLYFKHQANHGLLNLKSNTLFKDNELDEVGRPSGVIESDLIPLSLTDTAYISDLEKDTDITLYQKKIIGDVVLLERYTDQVTDVSNGLGQCLSDHQYLCYNKVSRRIYFESDHAKFSIGGMPFTQINHWHYAYPTAQANRLGDYDHLIRQAKPYQEKQTEKTTRVSVTLSSVPAFTFSGLDGTAYRSGDIQQHYTLLEFWYISCAPCLKNMQKLNELYKRYKHKDIKFLVLNDADRDAEHIKRVQQKSGLSYDVYYQGDQLKHALGITAHPHTIIYDTRSSKIIHEIKGTGDLYIQEIEHVLDSLLNRP